MDDIETREVEDFATPTITGNITPIKPKNLIQSQLANINLPTPGELMPTRLPFDVSFQPNLETRDAGDFAPNKDQVLNQATPSQSPSMNIMSMGNLTPQVTDLFKGIVQGAGSQANPITQGKQLYDTGSMLLNIFNPNAQNNTIAQMGNQLNAIADEARATKDPAQRFFKSVYSGIPVAGPIMNQLDNAMMEGRWEDVGNILGTVGMGFVAPQTWGKILALGGPYAFAKTATAVRAAKTAAFEKMQSLQAGKEAGLIAAENMKQANPEQIIKNLSPGAQSTAIGLNDEIERNTDLMTKESDKIPVQYRRKIKIGEDKKGKPIYTYEPIEGGIEIPNTLAFARDEKLNLSQELPSTGYASTKIRKMLKDADFFTRDPMAYTAEGKPMRLAAMEFRRLEGLSRELGDFLSTRKGTPVEMGGVAPTDRAFVENLKANIDKDIEAGLKKNSPTAYQARQNIQAARQRQADLFFQGSPGEDLLKHAGLVGANWEDAVNSALSSESNAENFIKVTKNRKALQDIALRRLGDQFTDFDQDGTERFDAAGALKELNGKKKGLYTKIIEPDALKAMNETLHNIASRQAGTSNYPGEPFNLPLSKWIGIPSGMIAGALLGHRVAGEVFSGVGVGVGGATKYFDVLMSNPRTAQSLINISKLPPGPRRLAYEQIVKNALRGTSAYGYSSNINKQRSEDLANQDLYNAK